MTAGQVVQADGFFAAACGEVLEVLRSEPLAACEVAVRVERPVTLVLAVLGILRARGLVAAGPGPDRGVTLWSRTR